MVLKRKFSILITMFVCLFALVGLTSCGSKTKLSKHEQSFLDTFTQEMLLDLNNPSEVKILSIDWASCDGKIVTFKISGQNSFGGTLTGQYSLVVSDITDTSKYATDFMTEIMPSAFTTSLSKGQYNRRDTVELAISELNKVECTIYYLAGNSDAKSNLSYNVANINNALKEFKISQGWA